MTGGRFQSWFTENAEQITRWGYTIATATLVVKNIATPLITGQSSVADELFTLSGAMDVCAAAAFFTSAHMFGLAKHKPEIVKKAGIVVMAAAGALIIGGWRGDIVDTSFYVQTISMLPTAWAGWCLTTNMKSKRTIGAIPELLSRPVHAIAGIMQGDVGQVVFAASGAVAEVGLIATDRKLNGPR